MVNISTRSIVKVLIAGQHWSFMFAFLLSNIGFLPSSAQAQSVAIIDRKLFQPMLGIESFFDPNLSQKVDGPNCINNALFEIGLNEYRRYTSVAELQTYINGAICSSTANNQEPSFNLGLLTWQGKSPTTNPTAHAFIKVRNDLAFEKRGSGANEPIRYVKISEILEDYGPDFQITYYKCQKLTNWIAAQSKSENFLKLNELLLKTQEIESQLQKQIYLNYDLSELKLIQRNLHAVLRELKTEFNSHFLSTSELTLKKIIISRFVSMAYQLAGLGLNDLSYISSKWLFSDKHIEELLNLL